MASNPWRDDFEFGSLASDMMSASFRNLREMERRFREMERCMHWELPAMVPPTGENEYQVSVDVQQFSPDEISVKTTGNSVIIEGNHEKRQDETGSTSRHFKCRYDFPPGYDANAVTCQLSSDGVLTVRAPSPQKTLKDTNERVVNIEQTGPARLDVKENEQAGKNGK